MSYVPVITRMCRSYIFPVIYKVAYYCTYKKNSQNMFYSNMHHSRYTQLNGY